MPDNSQSGEYQATERDTDHTLLRVMAMRRDADHAKFEPPLILVIRITQKLPFQDFKFIAQAVCQRSHPRCVKQNVQTG